MITGSGNNSFFQDTNNILSINSITEIIYHKIDLPPIVNFNCVDSCNASNFTSYGINNGSVLNWDLDSYCSDLVKNFTVEYKQNGSSNWILYRSLSNATRSITINNLTNNILYNFRLNLIRNDDTVSSSYCSSASPVPYPSNTPTRTLTPTPTKTTTPTPTATPTPTVQPCLPLSANPSLLLHFDNNFQDSSINHLSVSATGDAPTFSSNSKFGGYSAYFNGQTLTIPRNNLLLFDLNEDFTFETWINVKEAPVSPGVAGIAGFASFLYPWWGDWSLYLNKDLQLAFKLPGPNNGAARTNTNTSLTLDEWYHIAVVKSDSFNDYYNKYYLRLFINGIGQLFEVELGSTSSYNSWLNYGDHGDFYIGSIPNADYDPTIKTDFNGYIDELKYTKGYAAYKANFTPKNSPFLPSYNTCPTPTPTPSPACLPSAPTLIPYIPTDPLDAAYGPPSPSGSGAIFSLSYSPVSDYSYWPGAAPSWVVSDITVINGGNNYVYGTPLNLSLGNHDIKTGGPNNWIFMRTNRSQPSFSIGVTSSSGTLYNDLGEIILSPNLTYIPETNHWVGELWTISSIDIIIGGFGHSIGDLLTLELLDNTQSTTYGYPFSASVSNVDINGSITDINIVHGGGYYKEGGIIQGIANSGSWQSSYYRKLCCPTVNSECVTTSCSTNWDLGSCIEANIIPCYVNDGKLPISNPTGLNISIPSNIYINDNLYQYSSGLWINGSDTLSIVNGLYDFTYNGNHYTQNPAVRYRSLYQDYTLDESGSCDCYPSIVDCSLPVVNSALSYFSIQNGDAFWGNGSLQPFNGVPNDNDLPNIGLIVCGPFNDCGATMTDGIFTRQNIKNWINNGGILCLKTDSVCQNETELAFNQYLMDIGCSMNVRGNIGCGGALIDPNGGIISSNLAITMNHYLDTSLNLTCGLPAAIGSNGNSRSIIGGIPIATVNSCGSNGVSLAGEQIGDGAVFVIGDGNASDTPGPLGADYIPRDSIAGITTNILSLKTNNLPIFGKHSVKSCFNITYGLSSCRTPTVEQNCSFGDFSSAVDYSSLSPYSYSGYIDGCVGRPIDIDYGVCNSEIRPSGFNRPNFVLYYQAGIDRPLPVIDNTVYDTRYSSLVRLFSTNSASDMRQQVCNRLRFANVLDDSRLTNDLINCDALTSNWRYNDLYWYTYDNLPDEVSVTVIPC